METLSNRKSSVGISKSTSNYSIAESIKNVNPIEEDRGQFCVFVPLPFVKTENRPLSFSIKLFSAGIASATFPRSNMPHPKRYAPHPAAA